MNDFLEIQPPPLTHAEHGVDHIFDERTVHAVNGALAANRPLLVRGDPGVGKSQLARAVAARLGRPFLRFVVDAQTESRDLLYTFDAVSRLARAQLLAALGVKKRPELEEELAEDNFLRPGPVWWAMAWDEAKDLQTCPRHEETWTKAQGMVILIDEIDKGDPSVPNGLLSAFGEGWFEVPGGRQIRRDEKQGSPLIVVTSNEERMLPAAFLRRCFVLEITIPDHDLPAFENYVVPRGRAHHGDLDEATYAQAAEIVWEERARVRALQRKPPGLAEYIDLLRAVRGLRDAGYDGEDAALQAVKEYALRKHPEGRGR